MELSRCVLIFYLLVVCASAAPVDKETFEEDKPVPDLPRPFSNDELGSSRNDVPAESSLEDKNKVKDMQGDSHLPVVGTSPEDEVDGSDLFSEYDSLPSWYIDELLTSENDTRSQTDDYGKYTSELDELLLDVKLYQVYHSIKTLKSVLDDLISEELEEKDRSRDGPRMQHPVGQGTSRMEKDSLDRQAMFKKQLETLRKKQEGEKPRRFKRDLSWGEDELTSPLGDRNSDEEEADLSWLVKLDDVDDWSGFQESFGLDNEFDISKQQLRNLFSSFIPSDTPYAPYGNQVNINVGDQKLSQDIWYPKKRGSPQKIDRNFLSRLPTLEGMRKRRRTYMPLRRSRNEKSFLDLYLEETEPMMKYNQALFKREIARLAKKLARNTPRSIRFGSNLRDNPNVPDGDVNMWFENKPMYNIGIDDNIGDTLGLMQLDLPQRSPDPYDDGEQLRAYYDRSNAPRIQRRSMYVEEPSLPGPYQGYFVEGQLWHDLLQKRSPSSPLKTPEKLKIGGPNAWGNFIFINDAGQLPEEWLTQSFGEDTNNGEMPGQIQTEGLWVDGFDETQDEKKIKDQEEAWIRKLLGLEGNHRRRSDSQKH